MYKWLLSVLLVLMSTVVHAADCFDLAGRDYKIDPDLLRVDSQHFKELARYGIKPEQLVSDPCLNIYTGAYYLAIAFRKWGVSWTAVGAYNAGFKKTPLQDARRLDYATDVHRIWIAIKQSKTRQTPAR
ncbi:lytic transglycosylase [Salmonella enterica subsp. enterica serovar Enteritidis]|uniref:transglycosylase SLT domain-containing protein n=1 Tax=Salmonella enterica TaxID=28901 RepID=UPI0009AC699C|nr:transglycosylase SLT domain-containing protein [Salmonella enterica]OPT44747.1 lytic transglycosylase [Salmonella enterica subsp. enterica serovar Enteritidis]